MLGESDDGSNRGGGWNFTKKRSLKLQEKDNWIFSEEKVGFIGN